MNKTFLMALVTAPLLTACVAPTEAPSEEPVAAEASELRNGIILWFVEYDRRAGEFTVGVEVDGAVIDDPASRYLTAELLYDLAHGAGVSPFVANPMDQVAFERIGRNSYYTEIIVPGPPPANPDDVVARVGANPTPHP